MALEPDDVVAILADLVALGEGVAVTCGADTTDGVLLQDHALLLDALGGNQVTRVPAVVVKAGSLPSLAVDVAITVAGVARVVRDLPATDDRAVTVVVLA